MYKIHIVYKCFHRIVHIFSKSVSPRESILTYFLYFSKEDCSTYCICYTVVHIHVWTIKAPWSIGYILLHCWLFTLFRKNSKCRISTNTAGTHEVCNIYLLVGSNMYVSHKILKIKNFENFDGQLSRSKKYFFHNLPWGRGLWHITRYAYIFV